MSAAVRGRAAARCCAAAGRRAAARRHAAARRRAAAMRCAAAGSRTAPGADVAGRPHELARRYDLRSAPGHLRPAALARGHRAWPAAGARPCRGPRGLPGAARHRCPQPACSSGPWREGAACGSAAQWQRLGALDATRSAGFPAVVRRPCCSHRLHQHGSGLRRRRIASICRGDIALGSQHGCAVLAARDGAGTHSGLRHAAGSAGAACNGLRRWQRRHPVLSADRAGLHRAASTGHRPAAQLCRGPRLSDPPSGACACQPGHGSACGGGSHHPRSSSQLPDASGCRGRLRRGACHGLRGPGLRGRRSHGPASGDVLRHPHRCLPAARRRLR
mmetsp:Transcript_48526/g.149930  ORF Transcript_48526/g.149930 Transcript_48526/m.149930 type:complete len:332 (+) Transcript_48526:570-1565(+)